MFINDDDTDIVKAIKIATVIAQVLIGIWAVLKYGRRFVRYILRKIEERYVEVDGSDRGSARFAMTDSYDNVTLDNTNWTLLDGDRDYTRVGRVEPDEEIEMTILDGSGEYAQIASDSEEERTEKVTSFNIGTAFDNMKDKKKKKKVL